LSDPGRRLRADEGSTEIGADAQAIIRACSMRNDLKPSMEIGETFPSSRRKGNVPKLATVMKRETISSQGLSNTADRTAGERDGSKGELR
jgi:hypothetical protein